jgi:hypothetical protein
MQTDGKGGGGSKTTPAKKRNPLPVFSLNGFCTLLTNIKDFFESRLFPSAVGLGKKMTGAGFFFFDLLTLNRNFCNLKFYAVKHKFKSFKNV